LTAYSPGALVLLDFVWRLYGVRDEGDSIEWNCRLPEGAHSTKFSLKTRNGSFELSGGPAGFALSVAGKTVLRARGTGRVITDARGTALKVVGTAANATRLHLEQAGRMHDYLLKPDEILGL